MTHGIMSGMSRWMLLLATYALLLVACATEVEKQWYKPGASYTMAEFQRDQAACTKNKVVDEECLRERGWVAISVDKDTSVPMQGGLQTPDKDKRRYAPK
jgi:hypothetical protein